jgi:RimJ/RimL family protein N-acetyltransferase
VTSFADKPTLVGERVTLRPLNAADADDLWHDLHDPEANRLTGTHATFTRERIDAWCASRATQTDRLDLAVVDRGTGQWAGEVVINDVDDDNRSCSFRIALRDSARDRGLGTESTRLIVDHVFDRIDGPLIHRISLEVYSFNRRAQAVYERVGFRHEGVLRDALWWDGEFHDAKVMSILRTDLAARSD